MFDLKKYKSVRGGGIYQAMRDFDYLVSECDKRNRDLPTLAIQAIKDMPASFADLSITATAVTPVLTGSQKTSLSAPTILGATLTAGQAVYADSTTTSPAGQLKGTLCGGTAAQQGVVGILITGGNSGQYAIYATGGQFNLNSILGVTTEYFMSATAGKICPLADLVSTNEVIRLIYGISATVAQMAIQDLGVKP